MDLLSLTWESLVESTPLAVIVVLVMQLFGKRLLDLLVALLPEEHREQWRSIIINVTTWGLCYLIVALHIDENLSAGNALVVSLQAAALATGIYQTGKSVTKVLAKNLP